MLVNYLKITENSVDSRNSSVKVADFSFHLFIIIGIILVITYNSGHNNSIV